MGSTYERFKSASRAASEAGAFVRGGRAGLAKGAARLALRVLLEARAAAQAEKARLRLLEQASRTRFKPLPVRAPLEDDPMFVIPPRPVVIPDGWSLIGGCPGQPGNYTLQTTVIPGFPCTAAVYDRADLSPPYGSGPMYQQDGFDRFFFVPQVFNTGVSQAIVNAGDKWGQPLSDPIPEMPYLPFSGVLAGSFLNDFAHAPVGAPAGAPISQFVADYPVFDNLPVAPVPADFLEPVSPPSMGFDPARLHVVLPRPYEVPSENIVVTVGRVVPEGAHAPGTLVKPGVSVNSNPHQVLRPPRGTKERKVKMAAWARAYSAAMRIYGEFTEGADFVKAVYKSLPAQYKVRYKDTKYFYYDKNGTRRAAPRIKKFPTTVEMLAQLYKHWDKIDARQAAARVALQNADDNLKGIQGQRYKQLSQDLGLPSPLGVQFRGGPTKAYERLAREWESAYDLLK